MNTETNFFVGAAIENDGHQRFITFRFYGCATRRKFDYGIGTVTLAQCPRQRRPINSAGSTREFLFYAFFLKYCPSFINQYSFSDG